MRVVQIMRVCTRAYMHNAIKWQPDPLVLMAVDGSMALAMLHPFESFAPLTAYSAESGP